MRSRVPALAALLFAAALVTPARAGKDVFIRSKPHVNVGTFQGEATPIWFHANFGLFADGDATGIVQIRLESGEMFLFRASRGRALFDGDALAEVMLVLEPIGAAGGLAPAVLVMRPDSARADCLIYDIVGPNVHIRGEIEAALNLQVRRR